jgi:hypothetical protein
MREYFCGISSSVSTRKFRLASSTRAMVMAAVWSASIGRVSFADPGQDVTVIVPDTVGDAVASALATGGTPPGNAIGSAISHADSTHRHAKTTVTVQGGDAADLYSGTGFTGGFAQAYGFAYSDLQPSGGLDLIPVSVQLTATGGKGGNGSTGGNGRSVYLTDCVGGYSVGGDVLLTQQAVGGHAGRSDSDTLPGVAGQAESILGADASHVYTAGHGERSFEVQLVAAGGRGGDFESANEPPAPGPASDGAIGKVIGHLNGAGNTKLVLKGDASGGGGGLGILSNCGHGGIATTTLIARSADGGQVTVTGSAIGGAGASRRSGSSSIVAGFDGRGGDATCSVEASSSNGTLSLSSGVLVFASAQSYGGSGSDVALGATGGAGGTATATAKATAPGFGEAIATAKAGSGKGGVGTNTHAVDGGAVAEAWASAGGIRAHSRKSFLPLNTYNDDPREITVVARATSHLINDQIRVDELEVAVDSGAASVFTQEAGTLVSVRNVLSVDSASSYVVNGGSTNTVKLISSGHLELNGGGLKIAGSRADASEINGNNFAISATSGEATVYQSTIDVGTGAIAVHSGSLAQWSDMARAGQEGDVLFGGTGLTSAAAAADANGLLRYGVGVIPNSFGGDQIYTSFGGVAVGAADVLVAFTYFGDADLNGVVDGDDYFLLNNGYLNGLSGWLNGDFDYNGVVDGTDYFLLNNGFLNQGSGLRNGGTVPEPGTLAVLSLMGAGFGLTRTRARR